MYPFPFGPGSFPSPRLHLYITVQSFSISSIPNPQGKIPKYSTCIPSYQICQSRFFLTCYGVQLWETFNVNPHTKYRDKNVSGFHSQLGNLLIQPSLPNPFIIPFHAHNPYSLLLRVDHPYSLQPQSLFHQQKRKRTKKGKRTVNLVTFFLLAFLLTKQLLIQPLPHLQQEANRGKRKAEAS